MDHNDPAYTEEPPDSVLPLHLPPVYWEESGAQTATSSALALHPCRHCGRMVLEGDAGGGRTVLVEPEVETYTLVWLPKEARPRLSQSRGYPAHRCAPQGGV
jgi:hypothetical protein